MMVISAPGEDGRCLVLERPSERRRGIAAFVVDAQHDAGATAVFNHDVRDGVFAAHAQRKRLCGRFLLGGNSDEDRRASSSSAE